MGDKQQQPASNSFLSFINILVSDFTENDLKLLKTL